MSARYFDLIREMKSNTYNHRLRLVESAKERGIKPTARLFTTTVPTVRKWLRRFQQHGPSGLLEHSRARHHQPHQTPPALEARLVELRKTLPTFGARRLIREFDLPIGHGALERIWHQHGLIRKRRRKQDLAHIKAQWALFQQISADTKDLDDIPRYWLQAQRFQLPIIQYTARDVRSGLLFWAFAEGRSASASAVFASRIQQHLDRYGISLRDLVWQTDNGGEFKGDFPQALGDSQHVRIPPSAHTYQSDVETVHRLEEDEFFDLEDFSSRGDFLAKAHTYQLYFNLVRPNSHKGHQSPWQIIERLAPRSPLELCLLPPVFLDYYLNDSGRYDVPRHPYTPHPGVDSRGTMRQPQLPEKAFSPANRLATGAYFQNGTLRKFRIKHFRRMWSRIAGTAVAVIYHSDVRSTPLENSSSLSSDRARITQARFRRVAVALPSLLLFCVTATLCQAQTREVLCSAGSGTFVSEFHTGVKVQVGAARSGELATRACKAELTWNKQKLLIASSAPRIDVDAFGVDLGVGVPVVAIQVKKTGADCCMSYQIYSLQKPPRLLRTITGADSFSAADTDLDGRVEIWTDDSAAVNGFENLDLRQLEFVPPIVLRFANNQLLDVSAEFQPYFDQEIAKVRAELDARQLSDFKNSDGSDYLQDVKLKVLEIVWSYVYSGRERQAWQSLADMWPASDVDRIRTAILQARSRGIRSQVDGVSTAVPVARKDHVEIFDGIRPAGGVPTVIPMGRGGRTRMLDGISAEPRKPDLVLPELIELWAPASMGASAEVVLDLVIDSAGKVRSAAPVDTTKAMNADLLDVITEWKFIPAFKDGRPVASRLRVAVSPER